VGGGGGCPRSSLFLLHGEKETTARRPTDPWDPADGAARLRSNASRSAFSFFLIYFFYISSSLSLRIKGLGDDVPSAALTSPTAGTFYCLYPLHCRVDSRTVSAVISLASLPVSEAGCEDLGDFHSVVAAPRQNEMQLGNRRRSNADGSRVCSDVSEHQRMRINGKHRL